MDKINKETARTVFQINEVQRLEGWSIVGCILRAQVPESLEYNEHQGILAGDSIKG